MALNAIVSACYNLPKVKIALIALLFIQGLTAVVSGAGLIKTNGLGIPIEWLENSPFDSFLIPGLILSIIVGGTSLIAAFLLFKNHKYSLESAAVAGFVIQIWIFTQIYMLHHSSFLQVIYFSSGTVILIFSILLLKKPKKS